VVRDEFANFLDCVNLLDRNVGALLDTLKRDGVYENTLIFFMGDNGRCLIRGKQWCYDAGTHVPMIARWPGRVKPGSTVSAPVLSLDMTATTLAAAGLAVPEPFHGRPLWGAGAKPRDYVVTARDRCDMTVDRIRCVRDARYAYIRNFMPERPYTQFNRYIQTQYPTLGAMKEMHEAGKLRGPELVFMAHRKPDVEFYDLKQDPHEIRNLADDPSQQKRITRYAAILDQWIASTGDQGRMLEPPEAYADQM
jgi:arylsulfatase A-like enzyme